MNNLSEFKIQDMSDVFCKQHNFSDGYCVGTIEGYDGLYLICQETQTAKRLPEQYQNTPIYVYPQCGGYKNGLVMVSLMDKINLAYHHNKGSSAGIWGWTDKDFNIVIEPQYIFAENFIEGKACVCKGNWIQLDDGRYNWKNEAWGIIDMCGKEIVPCKYDELYPIDDSDNLYLAHKGGWENGIYCVVDCDTQNEILQMDFDFDAGYMFNEMFVSEDNLFFVNHLPGKGTDLIYVYNLTSNTFLVHGMPYTERTFNGESRVVVNKDGEDIIVF
ncbi:MAG: WG repeat-containing protein [Clostridia bacterium]|nr:WG repeat-containing protein [Clostridia bacterium]